jgi:peptidase E
MNRYIMATSGGFIPTGRFNVSKPGNTFLQALKLTGKERPRVLYIMTASGDDTSYLTRSYQAVNELHCDVEHLSLFTQPTDDVEKVIERADLIWVGGGSVANLLALWNLHGVDEAIRNAYENGTVLGGVSAGSICWHLGGPTDSFGPTLQVITNGLGLLRYGNGVHYDSEAQRRPLLQKLVGDGTLPTSFATDDRVGLLYRDGEPFEVISDMPELPAQAYRVEKVGNDVIETALPLGRI